MPAILPKLLLIYIGKQYYKLTMLVIKSVVLTIKTPISIVFQYGIDVEHPQKDKNNYSTILFIDILTSEITI